MAGASRYSACDLVLMHPQYPVSVVRLVRRLVLYFPPRAHGTPSSSRARYVLLLALPTIAATWHVLSATTLAHLRPHAVLVNVGRGDAIDAQALGCRAGRHEPGTAARGTPAFRLAQRPAHAAPEQAHG
jgi:hypothetical protein